jgi:hypothetical protein
MGSETMITSHCRGHIIVYVNNQWRYQDDNSVCDDSRACAKCGEYPTKEGYDACLGHIEDAAFACCGHGIEEPFISFEKVNNG